MANLFQFLDGIMGVGEGAPIVLDCDDQDLLINKVQLKAFGRNEVEQTYRIPLGNILDLGIVGKNEIVAKNKSAVGRGMAGGLLFGPAGLFLGGLSGTGQKSKNTIKSLLVISYMSQSNPEEPQSIVMDADHHNWYLSNSKYIHKLRKAWKQVQPSALVLAYKNPDGGITL